MTSQLEQSAAETMSRTLGNETNQQSDTGQSGQASLDGLDQSSNAFAPTTDSATSADEQPQSDSSQGSMSTAGPASFSDFLNSSVSISPKDDFNGGWEDNPFL